MKKLIFLVLVVSSSARAQTATAEVSLSPAGSFKITSNEVEGFAIQKGNEVFAKNIKVGLKDIKTGIELRDTHTKKYLDVQKYPEAILIAAEGKDGKGSGTIRIHGIDKKIEGRFDVRGNQLTAQFEINYQDFKIEKAKYMGIGVRDTIKLIVHVPIHK